MSIITISRQTGSLGEEVAKMLSSKLGWEILTRENILNRFLSTKGSPNEINMLNVSAKAYLKTHSDNISYIDFFTKELKEYVKDRSVIMLGFGAHMIFNGDPEYINVRIIAPIDIRISRVKKRFSIDDDEAKDIVDRSDKRHRKFVSIVYNSDLECDKLFDLVLNTQNMSVLEIVHAILAIYNERERNRLFRLDNHNENVINNTSDVMLLKNPAEMEFAKILDMYQIEWRYEPKTFPIEWDAEGNISLAFSPDFYLIKFDTYIELTTMDKKYMAKKNKKVKKLKEMYPGINIKLVNKRDYDILTERFKTSGGD